MKERVRDTPEARDDISQTIATKVNAYKND